MANGETKKTGTKSRTIKRKYRCSDGHLQQRAGVMHSSVVAELVAFTAKFPWLDAAWATNFNSDIVTALHLISGAADMLGLKVEVGDSNKVLQSGKEALRILNLYAMLAYPKQATMRRVFGQDNWVKARQSDVKMIDALKLAHKMANQNPYKTDLLNKGMQQADIDVLLTIADDLADKTAVKENTQRERPVNTDVRIAANNKVFEQMQLLKICSEAVYRDDFAKRKVYQLYPSKTKKKKEIVEAAVTGE